MSEAPGDLAECADALGWRLRRQDFQCTGAMGVLFEQEDDWCVQLLDDQGAEFRREGEEGEWFRVRQVWMLRAVGVCHREARTR